MVKRTVCVLLAAFCVLLSDAQVVGKYRYHKKDYFVYPLRIENDDELPQPGVSLPDGDYVVFHNYIFKQKRFGKHREVLKDTAKVVAYAHVKNGFLDGPATIYAYNKRDEFSVDRKPTRMSSGQYKKGLRDSTWTFKDLHTGEYSVSEYKNDLANGYDYSYNKKGQLDSKSKYRNGNQVDTVISYYASGQVYSTYDLYPDSEKTDTKNSYAIALKYFGPLLFENGPKTFYKRYDANGKIVEDLRYNKGQPLPFDSVSRYGTSVKVINGAAPGQFTILTRRDQGKYVIHTQEGYTDKSLTKYNRQEYSKKGKMTESNGYEIFPLDTTADPSKPQKLVTETWEWGENKTFFIPKYKFAYQEESRAGITSIDPSLLVIYMSDTTETPEQVMVVKKNSTTPVDSAWKRILRHNPYLEKENYITSEEFPYTGDPESHYSGSSHLDQVPRDYSDHDISTQYFKNGKLLNGKAALAPLFYKVHSNDSVTEICAGKSGEFSRGSLLNGKQQGVWEDLFIGYDGFENKRPKNLKKYFLAHPGKIHFYDVTTFQNGLKNGPYEGFSSVKEDDMDGPVLKFNKAKRAEQWKKNLSKSKKIFVYKSEESNYLNDTLEGPFKNYHSNGALDQELFFVKGRSHGDYKRYSAEGNLMASGHFENGKFDGPFYAYKDPIYADVSATNRLRMKAVFKNNLLNDTLLYYYDGSRPYMAIKLRNDTLLFKKQYFEDGRLQEDITFTPQSAYTIHDEILGSSNYLEIINRSGNDEIRKVEADYRSYYNNGQVLAEGKIEAGYPKGDWKFYNINGVLVHQINFVDTNILLPGARKATEISGFYTGYYNSGKLRCRGYLSYIELSYDCFVKQDKPDLDFFVMDFYDVNGKQTVSQGNGFFIKYDENGLRTASGKLVNCREDSLWKYYTPEQKLTTIGNYVNHEKEGVWYDGDLEGINFEDGACFDQNNEYEMEEYKRKRKEIRITKTIYVNGISEKRTNFSSDLNKTYAPGRGSRYIVY